MPQSPTAVRPELGAGFADPVHDSQRVFRAVLEALSRPGLVVPLAGVATAPAPLPGEMAAVLLALADYETPVWLSEAANQTDVAAFLRFHTGARLVADALAARFAVALAPDCALPLARFEQGTPEYPDRSATLLLWAGHMSGAPSTDRAGAAPIVHLSGPGIETERMFSAEALDAAFWQAAIANHELYPLGVDMLLFGAGVVAGLPRSTAIRMSGG